MHCFMAMQCFEKFKTGDIHLVDDENQDRHRQCRANKAFVWAGAIIIIIRYFLLKYEKGPIIQFFGRVPYFPFVRGFALVCENPDQVQLATVNEYKINMNAGTRF